MKNMDKIYDVIFPTTFGASGGVLGMITCGEMLQTAISAAIFAVVGGIIGFYVNQLLKKLDKQSK